MKRYKKRFTESILGSVNLINADCEYIPKIKAIILKEYKKITGNDISILQPWNTIRNKYNLLPEDFVNQTGNMVKALGKSKVNMIWDTVEVTLSLLDMELHLQFEGYKLNKFIKVKI